MPASYAATLMKKEEYELEQRELQRMAANNPIQIPSATADWF
jgi:hypothetical protein